MQKIIIIAIAAAFFFGLASLYAPPDIRLNFEFQATKPQPPQTPGR